MNYAHVLDFLLSEFWAIEPRKLRAISIAFANIVAGKSGNIDLSAHVEDFEAAAPKPAETRGNIAILPLFGTISHRGGMFSRASGGTSTESFGRAFGQLIQDKSIGAVIIDTDTPGGTVTGVPELAAQVRAARAVKPVIAVVNGLNASAGLWITSGASEIVSIPSGNTGSIGVMTSHDNLAEAYKQAGIDRQYLFSSNAPYKTEGAETGELTAEARDYYQGRLDEIESMFIRDVAKGRGVTIDKVRSDFGRGRVLSAAQSVKAGMIDRVATIDHVVGELATGKWAAPQRIAAQSLTTGFSTGLRFIHEEAVLRSAVNSGTTTEDADPLPTTEPVATIETSPSQLELEQRRRRLRVVGA